MEAPMREVPATFSNVTSRIKAPNKKRDSMIMRPNGTALLLEMRKNCFPKELRLADAVVTPNLQPDVRTACRAILLDALDALVGSAGYGANFVQNFVGHSLGSCFAPSSFHGVGNRLKLLEGQPRTFEKHVRGSLDVLNFIGEIHGGLFARAFFSFGRIAADAAHNDRTERQLRCILACFARTFFHVLPRVAREGRRRDTRREQPIAQGSCELLQNGPRPGNINTRNPARRVGIRL